jgi:hypothetical protein
MLPRSVEKALLKNDLRQRFSMSLRAQALFYKRSNKSINRHWQTVLMLRYLTTLNDKQEMHTRKRKKGTKIDKKKNK